MMKNRDQTMGIREPGSGIGNAEQDHFKQLLRSALPRLDNEAEPDRDLWPAMFERMSREGIRSAADVPWFDWALAGGLVAFAAVVPRTIPVILYYL